MSFLTKIDRLFLSIVIALSLLIGGVLVRGDQTFPQVQTVKPADEQISISTNQIVLTFSRNMDRGSVQRGLQLTPELPGKFSWIGKKMAYSFDEPLEAGQSLELILSGAQDTLGNPLEFDYRKEYRVSQKFLWFINESQQLVRMDPASQVAKVVTPEDLLIRDFRIHSSGQMAFLMSELDSGGLSKNDLLKLDLATGKTEKILDGTKEFIFSMELSPDGTFLLSRKTQISEFDQSSLVDSGRLWVYDLESEKWSPFWNPDIHGNELFFSPDGSYLVGRLINGNIAIVSVDEDADKSVYLENYPGSFALSPDGRKFVFVDFEDVFSSPSDLLLRKNDGSTKKLVSGMGQIQSPVFNQQGDKVYFLMNQFENNFAETGLLSFSPYHLYEYNLATDELSQITNDERYLEGFFSLSSDGKTLAFERYGAFEEALFGDEPQAEIWIYDLATEQLEQLEEAGQKPYLN